MEFLSSSSGRIARLWFSKSQLFGCVAIAVHLDTTTIASQGFPLPMTKEWGEGKGEGPPNNVTGAETSPSP
jgi:hypothetical protein